MALPRPTTTYPPFNQADFTYFAIVVGNEVAQVYPMRTLALEALVAALSSDPKIVVLAPAQKDVVVPGWTYNVETGEFIEPQIQM